MRNHRRIQSDAGATIIADDNNGKNRIQSIEPGGNVMTENQGGEMKVRGRGEHRDGRARVAAEVLRDDSEGFVHELETASRPTECQTRTDVSDLSGDPCAGH